MTVSIKPAYLERSDTARFIAVSETTLTRLVNEDKDFPKPREISGRRVAWLVRELEEWAEKRPVSRQLPPPNTGHRNRVRRPSGPATQGGHPTA